jgi:TetR/AcrR family transcriptional regulator, transcriptional repressor for nem operon
MKLVHEQGFNRTTLADIARDSGVPLGNVYYYFKTKEAIGEALIDKLLEAQKAAFEAWESEPSPRGRLKLFVQVATDSGESVARSGCQLGSLCAELHKDRGPLADHSAKLFTALLQWVETQFRLSGKGRESRDLAVHLVSAVQGASLLANTFHDPRYLTREGTRLKEWIRSL